MSSEDSGLIFEPSGRYLSLHGPYIDNLGAQTHTAVSSKHRQQRFERDGEGHHVTFINHLEIADLPALPKLGDEFTEETDNRVEQSSNKQKKKQHKKKQHYYSSCLTTQFGPASLWKRPVDLGLGSIEDGSAITFFRVIHWPFGQHIRRFVGLAPTNFHITVGFTPRDVHLYKGPGTLLCLNNKEECSEARIEQLVNCATYYFNDHQFIRKLYATCWRQGQYKQVLLLTRLCIFCKRYRMVLMIKINTLLIINM